MPKDERPRPPYLRLVVNNTQEELARAKLLEAAQIREFNAGSFEKVLQSRDYLLTRSLDVAGVTDPTEAALIARDALVHALDENGTLIEGHSLNIAQLSNWAKHMYLNVGLEDFMRYTDAPELPAQNLARHLQDYVEYLKNLVLGRRQTRENVESALKDRNITIRNSDLTRLLVFDINKDQIIPEVLVLPSQHKPYNPQLVLLKELHLCHPMQQDYFAC